jgi:FMN phosphatase YigB (HAD superfamily)
MHRPNYTTVVLDLGGVLLNYTSKNTVGLTSTQIKSALDSPYWHEYERGGVSRQEAYEQVSQAFKIDLDTWTEALEQMKDGMQPNKALISAIKDLKTAYPAVKICCLSNIPGSELALLKDEIEGWGIIDQFIASSDLQQRKPEMGIYSTFLEKIQEPASNCIFIDDKVGSVVNAQCLGFKGIVFTTTEELIRVLHNMLGDPAARAKTYLNKNAKNLFCTMNTGNLQPDNFSQLLILHHTGDR